MATVKCYLAVKDPRSYCALLLAVESLAERTRLNNQIRLVTPQIAKDW